MPFGIPFLGNSPLASNFASSTVTLAVTASLGAAVAGLQTDYSCPLAAFQAMRFPQLFAHLKMGGGERKRETGREGDNIPVSSNFSCSPFTSFLGTLLMLILHEVLSLVSF